jgi:PhzF family phenazine biosynthesis protein
MKIPFFQIDAFTNRAFGGNPAAVCLLDDLSVTDDQLMAIAAENNLSETAFLWTADDDFRLRWFTPTVEISLCGHATLASAHALWQSGRISPQTPISFHTLSGSLTATPLADGWIELNFPALQGQKAELPAPIQKALGIQPVEVIQLRDRYLVELATENEVRQLEPDLQLLAKHSNVIVTSRADAGSVYDFVSRFFAPTVGVPEDPVTGSAHCALAPYWSQKLGKTDFLAYQASKRGGVLKIQLADGRVRMAGQAVTTVEGHFHLP